MVVDHQAINYSRAYQRRTKCSIHLRASGPLSSREEPPSRLRPPRLIRAPPHWILHLRSHTQHPSPSLIGMAGGIPISSNAPRRQRRPTIDTNTSAIMADRAKDRRRRVPGAQGTQKPAWVRQKSLVSCVGRHCVVLGASSLPAATESCSKRRGRHGDAPSEDQGYIGTHLFGVLREHRHDDTFPSIRRRRYAGATPPPMSSWQSRGRIV